MVVVTAADRRYLGALANLVGSLHHWSPGDTVVIYGLALAGSFQRELASWNHVDFRDAFEQLELPAHCRELRLYAWKPPLIRDALARHESVLWVDAGSDFRASPAPLAAVLERDGHLFVQGQDLDMVPMSHPETCRTLGIDWADLSGRPHFAGNLQGYRQGGRAVSEILEPLVACALNRECIAPSGSSLANHRYDQTALSAIIYRSGIEVRPATHLLASQRGQLNADPLLPSERVLYTARGRSREYVARLLVDGGPRFARAYHDGYAPGRPL